MKTVIAKLNDICRICGESIRVTGRGSLNMFRGEKSKKQLLSVRFSELLRDEVVQVCGKSECACNKCVRELEKYEKAICNADLLRKAYVKAKLLSEQRLSKQQEKRCNSSPSYGFKRACTNISTGPDVAERSNPRISKEYTKRRLVMGELVENTKENEASMTMGEMANADCCLNILPSETNIEVKYFAKCTKITGYCTGCFNVYYTSLIFNCDYVTTTVISTRLK